MASINHVAFSRPVPLGSVLTLEAKVSRAVTTSLEVFIEVWNESRDNKIKTKVNEAIFTFVAVDKNGNPVKVPQLLPETEIEKQRFDAALRRRHLSLVLAGKLQAKDATELKALFE